MSTKEEDFNTASIKYVPYHVFKIPRLETSWSYKIRITKDDLYNVWDGRRNK